ncbi:MAG: arginyltransferase [Alphaproteobacteria bacterium]|nr:MAG: arginyltransferase [Alphaproteobacteria bacterium]
MNDHSAKFPKFYMTEAAPCPYLEGQMERKVFTDLVGEDAAKRHETLNLMGFRRSQNIIYRPACEGCAKCISVRVRAQEFEPGKTMARTLKKFKTLRIEDQDPLASAEQFELLKTYLSTRHAGGGMVSMDEFEYSEMVESSPVTTRLVEYHEAGPEGTVNLKGSLVGVGLTDVMSDGLSLVYSFFNTEKGYSGLGTFIILDHILKAKAAGLKYVYLGYWIKDSRTMAYKARFQPLDYLGEGGWQPLPKQIP